MKLVVTAKKFGVYSKGDELENVPESTAKALIKSGVVEEFKSKSKKSKK